MKKRINVVSHGRFHMLDLARELEINGFDVKFYSFVPPSFCEKYHLPRKCYVPIIYLIAPILIVARRFPIFDKVRNIVQDIVTCLIMRKCDVLICMTGFKYVAMLARKRGAVVIFERGSKHIIEQQRILSSIPNNLNQNIPSFNIRRNLWAYSFADYISIASLHVARSFYIHNYPKEKLFINPYGVDLSMFHPDFNAKKEYDVIMVGGWSYRKGCDLIVEALRESGLKFLHVGGIVDLEFPNLPNFTHVDAVDQSKLVGYYNKAKIALLPSREEGLAMVQAQAIACNLPLVGSVDSGAEDLRAMVEYPEYITIVNEYTPACVKTSIDKGLDMYNSLGNKVYAGKAIENLTWSAYGKRYADFIKRIVYK